MLYFRLYVYRNHAMLKDVTPRQVRTCDRALSPDIPNYSSLCAVSLIAPKSSPHVANDLQIESEGASAIASADLGKSDLAVEPVGRGNKERQEVAESFARNQT
jgi:hypothetical protein